MKFIFLLLMIPTLLFAVEVKISNLPSHGEGAWSPADMIPIVDSTAPLKTKKTTIADFDTRYSTAGLFIPLASYPSLFDARYVQVGSFPVNLANETTGQLPLTSLASLTASRAVISSGLGVLTTSATTSTQIGYLSTLRSDVQVQIDAINSSNPITAVNVSSPLTTTGGTTPTLAINKATTLVDGYLDHNDFSIFNNKQPAGSYLTALTNDVTASGPGSASATVNTVGGASAVSIASAANTTYLSPIQKVGLQVSLTSVPTTYLSGVTAIANGGTGQSSFSNGIVKVVTGLFTSVSNLTLGTDVVGSISTASLTGTINLATQTNGSLPSTALTKADATHDGALSASDWSVFNGKQAAGNYITDLTNDVSASGPGSSAATVNSVGGSSAANIHTAEIAANAASSPNTANTIVKRDSLGNFAAGTITANLTGNASGTASNITGVAAVANGGTNKSSWLDGLVKVVSNVFTSVSYPLTIGTDVVGPVAAASVNGTLAPSNLGMTNSGDLVQDASGSLTRIPIGSVGQVLTVSNNNTLTYQTPATSTSPTWQLNVNIGGASFSLGSGAVSSYTELTASGADLVVNSYPSTASFPTPNYVTAVQLACISGTASSGLTCPGNASVGFSFVQPATCASGIRVCTQFSHYISLPSGATTTGSDDGTFKIVETSNTSSTIINPGQAHTFSYYDNSRNSTSRVESMMPVQNCSTFPNDLSRRTFRIEYIKDAANAADINEIIADRVKDRDINFTAQCANN